MKRIILALAAATTALVGLDRVGVTPIAPGYDSGLEWTQWDSLGTRLFTLRTDAGDLDCLLHLKLRIGAASAPMFKAQLSDGQRLAVSSKRQTDGTWGVEISKAMPDSTQRAKFAWPSGVTL